MSDPRYLKMSNASPDKQRAILERHMPADRSGCWPWPGNKTRGGYGVMRVGPKQKDYVHRVSYRLFVGPIPDGYHLDHLCRTTLCFNPAHLEAVPPRVNVLRGVSPVAVSYRTDRCRSGGHAYTPENTILDRGYRRCRACHNAWNRARRARLKEQAAQPSRSA